MTQSYIKIKCDGERCLLPFSDLKPLITTHIKSKWQNEWDENINKLHEIEPTVGKPPQIHAGSRRDQVVLNRCRIGHSRLTRFFAQGGTSP